MTEQELREKIAELHCPFSDNDHGERCPNGISYCKDCPFALAHANEILALIKEADSNSITRKLFVERVFKEIEKCPIEKYFNGKNLIGSPKSTGGIIDIGEERYLVPKSLVQALKKQERIE